MNAANGRVPRFEIEELAGPDAVLVQGSELALIRMLWSQTNWTGDAVQQYGPAIASLNCKLKSSR